MLNVLVLSFDLLWTALTVVEIVAALNRTSFYERWLPFIKLGVLHWLILNIGVIRSGQAGGDCS